MANVTWSELDFNQGTKGYLDATEVTEAKKKGVSNAFIDMTESDYNGGLDKASKFNKVYDYANDNVLTSVDDLTKPANCIFNAGWLTTDDITSRDMSKQKIKDKMLECYRQRELLLQTKDEINNKYSFKDRYYNLLTLGLSKKEPESVIQYKKEIHCVNSQLEKIDNKLNSLKYFYNNPEEISRCYDEAQKHIA